jgi:hypothetical protein
MSSNKNTSHGSFIQILLSSLVATLLVYLLASCGGGGSGSSGSSGDTSDDTTDDDFTYLAYDSTTVPGVVSFSDAAYNLSDATSIALNGTAIAISGTGATASGSVATITAAGTYNITGTLSDGQIKVNTSDAGDVRLYLNGVNITSSTASPIDVESAERVIVVLADGKANYLTDGTSNSSVDSDSEAIDACFYSKDDLAVYGGGSLTIKANYKDGIKCKDGLIIHSGTINVTSADDGIIGKNYLSIENGIITVSAGGDGIKSTNENTDTQGYVVIGNGTFNITAGADAIQAQTHVVIKDGHFTIETNNGSDNPIPDSDTTTSAKGLKANVGITVDGGYFDINSSDDALNCNDTIVINGGELHIASGDDGMHGDKALTINNGTIDITECYEGIEGLVITINNGDIHVISSDDPINGSDGSGTETQTGVSVNINGGYMYFECQTADGFDSNGAVVITGGTIIINGPKSNVNNNGILDYSSFSMSGGFLIGAGSSGMAMPATGSNSQNSLMIYFTAQQDADTLLHIESSDGTKEIVTFKPAVSYQAIEISSSLLTIGATYNIYLGGTEVDGTDTDGLGGTYNNDGTLYTSFTYDSSSKTVGTGGGGGIPGGGTPAG